MSPYSFSLAQYHIIGRKSGTCIQHSSFLGGDPGDGFLSHLSQVWTGPDILQMLRTLRTIQNWASCYCSRGPVVNQSENIAQWTFPQGEKEWSKYTMFCFFGKLHKGLVSVLPNLGCRWDIAYSRCLGTTENKKEVGGMLLLCGSKGP